ncbi:MAG: hypothetical protein HOW73_05695 [Polyangiaceae bacterium]|nr:hypothetical protein [Polyangiaceae bacterium]
MAEGRDENRRLSVIADRTSDIRPSDEFPEATMERLLLTELTRAGVETSGIEVEPSFTDALMARIASVDASQAASGSDEDAASVLRGIAERTQAIRVQDGFSDAVMVAVRQAPRRANNGRSLLPEGLMRTAPHTLLFASLAAAACLLLSWYTQREVDADIVSSADVAEVE